MGTVLDIQGSSVNFGQIAEDSTVYQTLEAYFAAASVQRNNNAENLRSEVPNSDHLNLSDAENSTYIITEDKIVLTYSVDSKFGQFIKTQNHPLHICRPLSKIWGGFLVTKSLLNGVWQSFITIEVWCEDCIPALASSCKKQLTGFSVRLFFFLKVKHIS